MIRLRPLARAILIPLGLAGCGTFGDPVAEAFGVATPETAIEYRVELAGAPSDEIDALLRQSLASFRLVDRGAASRAFLRRRLNGDAETAARIFRSEGYFQSRFDYEIRPDGPAGDAGESPAGAYVAAITVDPGPAFRLAEHRFTVLGAAGAAPPDLDAAGLGSPVGRRAQAAPIVAAEAAAIARLRDSGFAYAQRLDRAAEADLDAATLTVETVIEAGPAIRFGAIDIDGAPSVKTDYLLGLAPWEKGALYRLADISTYQRRLAETGLFRAVTVTVPEAPPEVGDGPAAAPVVVRAEEAPFRSVTAGLRYDSDEGPGARLGFQHRNLFGANERLRAAADIALDDQSLELELRKPQFLRDRQDLVAGLALARSKDPAFDELLASVSAGLERPLGRNWRIGYGGALEFAVIEEDGVEETSILLGAPVFAEYDGSDDLFNPTEGFRGRIAVTPYGGTFDGAPTAFAVLDGRGSAYYDLTGEGLYILAGRGRLGSVVGEAAAALPAQHRLYSGGGGSVRGYQNRFVGPLDADGDPDGGRSVVEFGLEARAQVFGDYGLALFVEGGSVSRAIFPDFADGVQVAAGGGVRYFTPIGPLRFDIGFPLNGRDEDSVFEFYLSIGQAY